MGCLVSSHKFSFRLFATVSSGFQPVNNLKNPVVSVISGYWEVSNSRIVNISVNVVWPKHEPTLYLINTYLR
jgi:hypothetical protein